MCGPRRLSGGSRLHRAMMLLSLALHELLLGNLPEQASLREPKKAFLARSIPIVRIVMDFPSRVDEDVHPPLGVDGRPPLLAVGYTRRGSPFHSLDVTPSASAKVTLQFHSEKYTDATPRRFNDLSPNFARFLHCVRSLRKFGPNKDRC